MSGTKEKTAGKQSTKGRAGKVSAQEVAQADASDLPGVERSVTLPGHYVAVGASPISVTLGDVDESLTPEGLAAGGGSENLIVATQLQTEYLNTSQGEMRSALTADGLASGADSSPLSMSITPNPATDDVVVLEVRARSERGFFRCGRFWPREPVHVFVSDDPDGDNEANALEGDVVVECFISHETAERLKAEPHLVVAIVPVLQVAEKD
ncbi:Uncharacterised protein [Klebsiella oxytoca]|uniref:hypothetical protein n=1 Tax=Bacteria TaxID=2 RepID=UPI0004751E85|nr:MULTISPECIES: hypothetical protein [Klebsiella]DAL14603.1 MAG TPA_asm: hypothetical protein [Caudoviricetes sp.]KLY11549.1 hypothetical protein SK88_03091 [Klebsiella oxytoca]MCW9507899.1 hypothetical protein [Klebsiella michiganensis]MDM4410223.1 hypothetical protein [Klebsiella oxytoca]MDM4568456.1 hypothetical protein [Klebsiella michiganensis]